MTCGDCAVAEFARFRARCKLSAARSLATWATRRARAILRELTSVFCNLVEQNTAESTRGGDFLAPIFRRGGTNAARWPGEFQRPHLAARQDAGRAAESRDSNPWR